MRMLQGVYGLENIGSAIVRDNKPFVGPIKLKWKMNKTPKKKGSVLFFSSELCKSEVKPLWKPHKDPINIFVYLRRCLLGQKKTLRYLEPIEKNLFFSGLLAFQAPQ